MTVTPYRANCDHYQKELFQYLKACQQLSIEKDCEQIISISQEIPPLDPLTVLEAIAKPELLQFYLEKPDKNQAIAAIDAVEFIKLEGSNRFTQAQKFIKSCLNNSLIKGNLKLPFSGVHFFCSFTFFEEATPNSPFPSGTVFLPKWQVSRAGNTSVLVANLKIKPHSNLEFILENLLSQIKIINWQKRVVKITKEPNLIIQHSNNSEQFKQSVASAINSIQAHQFRKIVLASTIDLISSSPFQAINLLANLRKHYPGCHIFSTSNNKGQSFIGASPERLISIKNNFLETDALAGSAPRGQTIIEDASFAYRLMNSEKERREHQFVLNFITKCLSDLGLNPQMLPIPQLLKLPNIQHLWTPIHTHLPKYFVPLEIVEKLHPTPAMAGVPTKKAQEQIRNYETFDRSLYAAPLGWIDHQGNCEFIVAIRSALIDTEKPLIQPENNIYCARLYAGAGIVAGSDPNKELAEIQLKLQALSKAFF